MKKVRLAGDALEIVKDKTTVGNKLKSFGKAKQVKKSEKR